MGYDASVGGYEQGAVLALPQVVVAHQLFHAFVAEAELQLLVEAVAFYYFAEKRLGFVEIERQEAYAGIGLPLYPCRVAVNGLARRSVGGRPEVEQYIFAAAAHA